MAPATNAEIASVLAKAGTALNPQGGLPVSTNRLSKFEAEGHDHPGFWGEQTSTIDWCERNYVVTPYIAEFWNTISNSAFILVGLMGMVQAIRHRYEPRFVLIGLGIMIVGFGSSAFHGTLLFEYQMADELPMIWSIMVWNYAMFLCESTKTTVKHTVTATICATYAIVYSVMHVYFAFTTTFQLNFALMTLISGYILHRQCCEHTGASFIPFVRVRKRLPSEHFNTKEIQNLYSLCWHYAVVITSALAVWLIDQHACDVLHNLPFGIPNPQLHAWWHVLCGYNCHLGLQLSIGLREKVLNKTRLPQTIWYGEVWPITNRGGKDEKSED
ncbi:hypothetical protein TeGR_g10727 [Tetraparma gracilis]|uniref:Alkaline phytoceramidase n=1 Tax=Tetraparma gracilis TaxID=2962635 RepID=A0ABQ6M5H9_9STRA|nr:hypothetical protein TeGR_g10727 [Tetraparma gracilis]